MNVENALKNMEMDRMPMSVINSETVKKQYKKMALKLHPDKNGNTPESTRRFQDLSESYRCLLNIVQDSDIPQQEWGNSEDDNIFSSTPSGYFDILRQFIKSTINNIDSDNIVEKIRHIVENCQDVSVSLFENIDRDTSITIFQFLTNYRELLHLSDGTLEKVKTVIQQKFEELEIYTIDPSLHDILVDNVYRLKIHEEVFLIPLWHKEMYFDTKNNKELMVICQPMLPDGWWIDENNNIYGSIDIVFTKDLLDIIVLPAKVDDGKHILNIETRQLKFTREQVVCLKQKGMLRINERNIYDTSERRDINLVVNFV